MKFRGWVLVVGLCVTACGGGTDPMPSAFTGGGMGTGGGEGGIPAACNPNDPVAWDEQTQLGKSAAEAFASLPGTCTTALSWDAKNFDNVIVSPSSGSSDLTVTVTLDQSSARTVIAKCYRTAPNPPAIQVDAHVHLETKDGTLVVDKDVPAEGGSTPALSFSISPADLGGSLSIEPKDAGTTVMLRFTVEAIASGCIGTISLDTSSAAAGNIVFGGGAEFGKWTDTGCPAGQKKVILDAPGESGRPSLSEIIQAALSKASYSGTWDDGTMTELAIQFGTLPTAACVPIDPGYDVAIPMQITYATADGRVASHTAQTDLSVLGYAGTQQPEFQLDTSEDFACDSATATLPFTPADCRALRSITMQLHLGSMAGGDLTVYEYNKTPNPTGAADMTQKLSLSAP